MNWQALDQELARGRDIGRSPTFWWRDDDAAQPTAAVKRLLALSRAAKVPVALAVVPLAALPELFADLPACVLMHGTDHRNRAAAGEKKTEFSATEPEEAALRRLREARERLAGLAGRAFLPVLAPPWNRIRRSLVPHLPELTLRGLSGFGARGEKVPGVMEINTHIDIIDWHGTRAFIGEEPVLRGLISRIAANTGEPTGVLTHHAVHDEAAWAFLERLYERTRRHGARWADARSVFPASG
jgi:hypothetical protein